MDPRFDAQPDVKWNHQRWVPRMASALLRVGTWGLDPDFRSEVHAERLADLDAQLNDPRHNGGAAILERAVRTLAGDVGRRLTGDNLSSVPASISFLFAGLGALFYSAFSPTIAYQISLTLNGIGLLVLALNGLRQPRMIKPLPWATGAFLIAAGSGLGVFTVPEIEEASLFASTARAALLAVALCFALFGLSLANRRHQWMKEPALFMAVTGAALLAFSEIGYALYIASHSLAELAAALLVATGALMSLSFFARLRHLPVEATAPPPTIAR